MAPMSSWPMNPWNRIEDVHRRVKAVAYATMSRHATPSLIVEIKENIRLICQEFLNPYGVEWPSYDVSTEFGNLNISAGDQETALLFQAMEDRYGDDVRNRPDWKTFMRSQREENLKHLNESMARQRQEFEAREREKTDSFSYNEMLAYITEKAGIEVSRRASTLLRRRIMYEKLDCVDSYRAALVDDEKSMANFKNARTCCGSAEWTREIDGVKIIVGCNHGH